MKWLSHIGKQAAGPDARSAMVACVATALAELLGAAIGLNMLTGLPLVAGAVLSAGFSAWMLFSNTAYDLRSGSWVLSR